MDDKSFIFFIFLIFVAEHDLIYLVLIPVPPVVSGIGVVPSPHEPLELCALLQFLHFPPRVFLNTPDVVDVGDAVVAVRLFGILFVFEDLLLFVGGEKEEGKDDDHEEDVDVEEVGGLVEVEELNEVLNDCHHLKIIINPIIKHISKLLIISMRNPPPCKSAPTTCSPCTLKIATRLC